MLARSGKPLGLSSLNASVMRFATISTPRTVRLREYDGEFVTSVPPENVAVTRCKSQHVADGGQRAITGLMPVVVVDLLQAVEVEHDEAERCLRSERST